MPVSHRRHRSGPGAGAGAGAGGMTLVETLVATLVFSIGLAGIATLLVQGLQTQREAARESGAATLLAGIGEEIRALHGGDPGPLAALSGADPAERCRTAPASCTRETTAAEALTRWRARVREALGASASAAVEPLAGGAAAYRVRIQWTGHRGEQRVALARIEP